MINNFTKDDILYIKQAAEAGHQNDMSSVDRLLAGSANQADLQAVIDMVSEDFSRNGLDDNDEPNDYGYKLDAIIDKLGEIAASSD